jgi:UDP-3-O-[3-hydroxymyristoyl] glucosamine N-acyltransferase
VIGRDSPTRGLTLQELAVELQGEVEGDPSTLVSGAAWSLDEARAGDIVRAESDRWLASAEDGPAAAVILGPNVQRGRKPVLRVANPSLALARLLPLFYPTARPAPGIDPSAILGPDTQIGESCTVQAYCVLGAGAHLGRGVILHPHVVVGDGVRIGDETEIFPHVTLYSGVRVGARVRLHSGVVIGADGFGYIQSGREHVKIPQVGTIEIGDDVEIGANSTIDRATTGVTRIGAGTKIDNLVQIGHNVRIGEHCILVSQVGIAGSAAIEENVVIAAQAGVKDNVRIGANSLVLGRGGVIVDLAPGSVVSGFPARPHREQLQVQAATQRLPLLQRAVRALERRLSGEDKVTR